MIECINLDNFALTGHTSRYNEDSYTAQNLLIKSARRTKDCMKLVTSIGDGVKTMLKTVKTSFDAKVEELAITEQVQIIYDKSQSIMRYYFLINENSKSLIELASDINKTINNMLIAVPELTLILKTNIVGIEDKLNELEGLIDSCYLDVYDSCSYTTLELAGNTAKNVNDFIEIVNNLEEIIDYINKNLNTSGLGYDTDGEILVTLISDIEDETINI